MTKRIQLSDAQRKNLRDLRRFTSQLSVNGKSYTLQQPSGSGYKAVVWQVSDEHSRHRALKLSIYDDYTERSYLEEANRAAKLELYPEFAHFIDAGLVELPSPDGPTHLAVAFVEEWVDGHTLPEFLRKEHRSVSTSFLLAYVKGICNALSALRTLNLAHDDLHAKNVMLARPAAGALSKEWSVKIVDTGSLKPSASQKGKPKDDHRHFVDHLILIWNAIHRRRSLAIRDRRFLNECQKLFQSMLDDEPGIALREPAQVDKLFSLAHTRSNSPRPTQITPPISPFEYISAEHIADDRLLVQMFARSCPFLAKVDGPDPCLVTGPRGCGKSTIFRWLSLKAHLHKEEYDPDEFRVAGFYLSCSSDLQNKLGWMRTEALARRFRREIIHYFNLLLAREILHTLSLIAARADRITLWGFGDPEEVAVWTFILQSIGQTSRPRVQGISRLGQATELIEEDLLDTHGCLAKREHVTSCTSAGFLGDLTQLMVKYVPFFSRKRITFLVDDFSSHRIPPAVQVVLNQVIWERRSSHIFKLSSEKYGAQLTDSLGANVDISREMLEIDCGREYVALDDSGHVGRAKAFAIELLDNRLKAAGYQGDSAMLIGASEWQEGSLGRALANRRHGRTLNHYHGLDCIANVCSGDVSTLLLVFRHIFELGEVTAETTTLVPKHIQHRAIVGVSRELFEAIRHYLPNGPQMYSVVSAFGTLVRNILSKGRWQKKGNAFTPPQCPRIELDQRKGGADDRLTSAQEEIARELIRRAIFIEMQPGLSRHGNVTTLRWQMRRVYLPAFGAALAKNDAVKEPIHWLKFFLTNPEEACDGVWRKWATATDAESQRGLFPDHTHIADDAVGDNEETT